jgi:outer membrane protein OmpA-like peptidoglycan-associated protein
MSAHILHIDLPDATRPSVWPWLIALLSAASLIVVMSQELQSIPDKLQQQAQQLITTAALEDVSVVADGRDLQLVGSIDKSQSLAPLLETLSALDGVRIVRDDLARIDSAETALQRTQDFLRTLAGIHTSAVAFQPGSNSFTSGSDIVLTQIAQLLKDNPDKRIRIEGHTDDTGPASVNLRLSQERAEAVARYLQERDVSPDQLIAKGYGSTQPIDDNQTESGRARNRRIEISYVD